MTALYVHVPFCRHRCPYCDFNVVVGADDDLRTRYVAAVRAELERTARDGPPGGGAWPVFGSVFVGGGTPTQLPAGDLADLLRHARKALPVADDAETSVEANPEDVTASFLAELTAAGLTRLSLGAQSFAPHVLSFLGRAHEPARATSAVDDARRAGVASVSLDLIYGAPNETDDDWHTTLETAVDSGVDHVSCYALTVETNTPYAAAIRRGHAGAPDDDTQAARMAAAEDRLARAGYTRYEISNWARPGHASRHNLVYWRGGNWLGVGPGAHAHWDATRWWNIRPTARYVDRALAGEPTVGGSESLDRATQRTERLIMGLRLAEGVRRAEVEPVDEEQATRLVGAGLLLDDGERLTLTPGGRALADDVTVRLLART